ncbi:MAG: flippase activity-associated protein Agl23 [Chloroflexota bacterium]
MKSNPTVRFRAASAPVPDFSVDDERPSENAFSRIFPRPNLPTLDVVLIAALLVGGLFLRLVVLGDRPLHHDESLHATYSWYLMGSPNPQYNYDPMMHGPLQFHMIAFFYSIFGSSPFTARLWSVTCGTALIAVPLLLYRQLGRWPTFIFMTMLCLSPVTLYFSRFAREDMQYALFTLLLVVSIIRFVLDHKEERPGHYRWLYVIALAFIMAYAAKESIYLTAAVLGAFIGAQLALELVEGAWWAGPAVGLALMAVGVLGHQLVWAVLGAVVIGAQLILQLWVSPKSGMLSDAMRASPWRAWTISGAIIVLMFVLLYWPIGHPASWAFIPGSNQVTTTVAIAGAPPCNDTSPNGAGNVDGLPPCPKFTYSTDGLLGGLQYWQEQQLVARGGQPWFYYLLIIPLYEWTIVPFGIIGAVYILRKRRDMMHLLLLWWFVATLILYCYASEKMPWNSLHLVVPLAALAAIGLWVSVTHLTRWVRYLAIAVAVITTLFSLHNSFMLSYVNGANPVEMMVYVQTSKDVPAVYSEMQRIQSHVNGALHLQVDSDDTWPWAFYLRDTSKFWIDAYPTVPADYKVPDQPVLLVSDSNYPQMATSLSQHYVAFRENLRWWGPEEYKGAYVDRFNAQGKRDSRLQRLGFFLKDLVTPSTWGHILQWEVQRRPFTPTAWDNHGNQTDFYFVVKKELVQYLSPKYQAMAKQQLTAEQQADPFLNKMKPVQANLAYGQSVAAGAFQSAGPIAVDPQGNLLVGDLNAHRIVVLSPAGKLLRTIGSAGTGPGQFNAKLAPSIGGIAVAANGTIYATDTWNQRVEEFSPTGTFIRAWGQSNFNQTNLKPGDFYGPRGIAVAPNGNVYVADTGHRRIEVFDPNGKFLFTFGTAGTQPGQFDEPSGVAIDAKGHVFVADFWNERVQELTATGAPLLMFPVQAWQAQNYDEPQIAVGGAGRIFVPDPQGSRILVYTPKGAPDLAWGGFGTSLGQLSRPLAILSTGHTLFVNDSGNSRVLRYTAP